MHRSYQLLPAILQASVLVTNALALSDDQRSQIQWTGPCTVKNQTVPMVCGTLDVPRDYTDSGSNETITLDIAKVAPINACEDETPESIILSFGGPGEDSLITMAARGAELQAALGGEFELVTFNPRGVGKTLPFTCVENKDQQSVFALAASAPHGTSSRDALAHIWNRGALTAEECYQHNKQNGELIGTAFVARDMMHVSDALGQKALNFWGISYGTVLGAVTVSMFPNRVGKVLLDGVVNPHEYMNGFDIQTAIDTDKVLAGFSASCFAAPALCPLAKRYLFPSELEAAIIGLLESLKTKPLHIPGGGSIKEITYDLTKVFIFAGLYSTDKWPRMSIVLDQVISRNTTGLASMLNAELAQTSGSGGAGKPTPSSLESLLGIKCSDKTVRASSLSQVLPAIHDVWSLSYMSGDANDAMTSACAQWKFQAKERYTGDFRVKTASPVLLVGNTFDPVTPLASAYNVSWGLEGSVVLEQHGYGHASIGQPSLCTANAIQAYFTNGSLPRPGTVCEPSIPPFTNKTWVDAYMR